MTSAESPPRYCKLCGHDCEADDAAPLTQPLSAPHIARPIGRSVDATYRAAEEGADFRATYAREVMGLDADAANALRITDMQDHSRPGEVAVMPVVNPVSQFMDANPGTGGFDVGAQTYAAHSAAVQQGPFPNAGARAQQALRKQHAAFTRDAGHKGATMSDVPALETQQPGYRPRMRTI